MFPKGVSTSSATTQKKEKWSKLTYDQRMVVLVQTIQILKSIVGGYERSIRELRRHKHDPQDGTPYITKNISGGYNDMEPEGQSPAQYLPIDDYDFDELKII